MLYDINMIVDMDTKISRKQAHNTRIRAQIVTAAGRLFRVHGYDGVGLNELMAGAGLTRGAFYAHFASKQALFVAVMQAEHPILRKLQERQGNPAQLWQQMHQIFASYLAFENRAEIWAGCSIAMLTHDVGRSSPQARAAYDDIMAMIEAEVIRDQPIAAGHPNITAAVSLAFGAVAQSHASHSPDRQAALLASAHATFCTLLDQAR